MLDLPLQDWMQKALIVGNYNDEPILVRVDELGQMSGGLGAYIDRYTRAQSLISTGSDINVDTPAVPAGELFIITNIAVFHNDPAPLQVTVYLRFSTTNLILCRNQFLLQNEVMDKQGEWVLKEDDYIRAVFVTPTSGKTGYVNVTGYKVEVAS